MPIAIGDDPVHIYISYIFMNWIVPSNDETFTATDIHSIVLIFSMIFKEISKFTIEKGWHLNGERVGFMGSGSSYFRSNYTFLDLILLFLNTEFCTSNIISAQNLGLLSVICRIGSKIFVFKNKHF